MEFLSTAPNSIWTPADHTGMAARVPYFEDLDYFLAVSASIWTPADHTLVTVIDLVGASGTPRSTWATQGDQASIRIERQGLPMTSRGRFLCTVECISSLWEQPVRALVFCKQFGSSRNNKQSNNQKLELQSVRVYACFGKILRLGQTLQKQQPRT